MKAIKYVGIALGALVLLLVVAAGLVAAFFDPNDYKDDLQRVVRERTGRELSLPGELKLSLYPWIAVELGPASLGNAPGFGAQPMLEIAHARLGVKLMPLLSRRVEIGSIELDAPVVRLSVDAQGRDNWSDLGEQQQQESAAGGQALEASIASLTIRDGSLSYDDRKENSRIAVTKLALETGRLQTGLPVDLDTQFAVQMDDSLQADLKFRARATLDTAQERYRFEAPQIELLLHGESYPKDGLPVSIRAGAIAADLKAQTLSMPALQLVALGAQVSGELEGQEILDAPRVSGPLTLASVSLRELLPKLGVELPATADAKAFTRFAFSGQLAATPTSLQLNRLKLQLDDSQASGSAGIADLDSMALRFDLNVDHIDADRYMAPAPATAPATAKVNEKSAPIEIPTGLLRDLNLRGNLAVGKAKFADIQYSNLRMGLNARGGKLRLYPSQAQMYGGQYSGDITLDASTATPRASFDEHVTGIDFAPLFADLFDTKKIAGRGNVAIKATASGENSDALLRTLSGTMNFKVDNGAFEGIDLWYEIRRARALLKKQAPPERSGPARTAFTALSGSARISNGVFASDDLVAATQYLRITGKGSTNLVQGQLDYRLEASVLKIPAEGADAEMADVVGFMIPVRISGPLVDPKVRPDLEGLAKAAVKRKVDEKKKEVEQQLKNKLQDKLKGLFGN